MDIIDNPLHLLLLLLEDYTKLSPQFMNSIYNEVSKLSLNDSYLDDIADSCVVLLVTSYVTPLGR